MYRTKKELVKSLDHYKKMFTQSIMQREEDEPRLAEVENLKEIVQRLRDRRLKMVEENDLLRKLLAMYMPEIHRYRRW